MRKLLFFLLIFCFLLGCEKDFLINSFNDCEKNTSNVDDFRDKIIGDWQLKEVTCGLCSGDYPQKVKENIRLTLKPDGTFVVTEDSENLEVGTWAIVSDDAGLTISVEVESGYPEYLPGIIGVCENQLFADLTYLDQFGYFYIKTN